MIEIDKLKANTCCDVLVVCLTKLVIDRKEEKREGRGGEGREGREGVIVIMVMNSRERNKTSSRKERK